MEFSAEFRSGYLAIIGKPNVGKSTLLNKLLDFKLSIISPRPQTTRRRIMGIMNDHNCQIVFLDTPGIHEPKYKLQQAMLNQIRLSISEADALIYLIDRTHISEDDESEISDELQSLVQINPSKKKVILVINKVDLSVKSELLPIIEFYTQGYRFESIVPISAHKGDGLADLKEEFKKVLPLHPPYYDPQIITEQPERFFVAEFIREQIFMMFHDEIPYSTEVQVEEFKERQAGKHYISANIYTERESQKGILIGKKGSALKEIGIKARKQIQQFLNRDIFLELRVKVRKDWRRNEVQIKKFGY
jgi:GTP-binding protein Era